MMNDKYLPEFNSDYIQAITNDYLQVISNDKLTNGGCPQSDIAYECLQLTDNKTDHNNNGYLPEFNDDYQQVINDDYLHVFNDEYLQVINNDELTDSGCPHSNIAFECQLTDDKTLNHQPNEANNTVNSNIV